VGGGGGVIPIVVSAVEGGVGGGIVWWGEVFLVCSGVNGNPIMQKMKGEDRWIRE